MNATIAQLTDHLLSLPIADRAALAQKLWESIELPEYTCGLADDAIALAKKRAAQVADGTVQPIPHAQVMRTAREALRCE